MWGNWQGWMISVAIGILFGALVAIVSRGAGLTPPTAYSADEANFQPLQLPLLAANAMPPTQDGDAGPLYRRAIEQYFRDRALYDDFAAAGTFNSPKVAQLDAIDLLVEAAGCGRMNLFIAAPADVVNYRQENEPLVALEQLGRVCVDRLALLSQRAGRSDDALKYYRAGFMLGLHLSRERLTYGQLQLGLQLLGKTAPMLARLHAERGEAEKASAFSDFDARRLAFAAALLPTARIVRSIDENIVGRHTGDVFELAKRSKERMWRVEAMIALGRVRFFGGAGGTARNQRAAMQLLREAAASEPDPVVKAAAAAARDLTVEQHRAQ